MATQLAEPEVFAEEAPRDYEAEARKMGWRPPEELEEGKRPATLKSAEEFVLAGDEKAGLQKQTIAHLRQEVSLLKRQVGKLGKMEQNAYANALADLTEQMRVAAKAGDDAGFDKANEKAESIRKEMVQDTGDQQKEYARELIGFRERNEWFDQGALAGASPEEKRARAMADRVAERMIADGDNKTLGPKAFLAALEAEVLEKMPELNAKPVPPRGREAVAGVSPPTGRSGAKTGANLPADAVETAKRYVRNKVPGYSGLTEAQARDKFAADYDWS